MSRRGLWILIFVVVVVLTASLATGWNVVLVQDYRRLLELARHEPPRAPILGLFLGTTGFIAVLAGVVLSFVKLLKEMRLNQLQAEFLATVSHELKTPIATLELSSSLLREGSVTSEERERLWHSHATELKRLKEDVEALLEAARMQSSAPRLRKTSVRLETWLEHSLTRWRGILGPNARIEREGNPLDCTATIDLRMLNLITDNLLDNALKFSRGAPHVVIATAVIPQTAVQRKARWRIQIRDSGWGFEPSDAQKIFKRFFRAKVDAPYAFPGTGLGLYLAATASRAMGISLKGESAGTGKGAVFTLEGPLDAV